jgi:hypothetical protein
VGTREVGLDDRADAGDVVRIDLNVVPSRNCEDRAADSA